MTGIRWTEEEYEAWAKANPNPARKTPNVEPAPSHESLAKKKGPGLDPQFRVRVITRGKRLGDVDGRSCKAVLDAFTKAGIWPDDNAVKQISFEQEPGQEDETIIEIWEA